MVFLKTISIQELDIYKEAVEAFNRKIKTIHMQDDNGKWVSTGIPQPKYYILNQAEDELGYVFKGRDHWSLYTDAFHLFDYFEKVAVVGFKRQAEGWYYDSFLDCWTKEPIYHDHRIHDR